MEGERRKKKKKRCSESHAQLVSFWIKVNVSMVDKVGECVRERERERERQDVSKKREKVRGIEWERGIERERERERESHDV